MAPKRAPSPRSAKRSGSPRAASSKESGSGMRGAALALIDSVLDQSNPVDLRALMRMCLQRLDDEATAARKAAEKEKKTIEDAAKQAAKAEQQKLLLVKEAERKEAAAAKEMAEQLKRQADDKRKAEEKAVREAATAAKLAAEAQRKAEAAEAQAKIDAENKTVAEAKALEEARKKAEAIAAKTERDAQRKADEAASREEKRLQTAEKALQKAEEKRRRAEQKALAEAERQAEIAREKAGLALDDALAAGSQVDAHRQELAKMSEKQNEDSPGNKGGSKSRRGRGGNGEDDNGEKKKNEDRGGGGFTIAYGDDRYGKGTAEKSAMEEDDEEEAAERAAAAAAAAAAAKAAEDLSRLPAWLDPFCRWGGQRSTEMDGSTTVQSDCLVSDGKDTLVHVGGDGDSQSVSLYSVKLGHCIKSLRGHTDKVVCVACQGDLIASGSKDTTIRLWSRKSGDRIATLLGCEDTVHALALRDGMMLSGEGGNYDRGGARVRLWSISNARNVSVFSEHRGGVWSVALGDGFGVSASHDSTARVWPTDCGEGSLAVLKHPNWVCSVCIDGGRQVDGKLTGGVAATGCADTRVRLWSLNSFQLVRVFEHGGGGSSGISPVFSVRMTPGGQVLLSGGQDHNCKVWALLGGSKAYEGREADSSEEPAKVEPEIVAECIATLPHGDNVRGVVAIPEIGRIVSAGGRSASGVIVWTAAPPPVVATPEKRRSWFS